MFQKIYEDAFKDELEKIALSTEGAASLGSTALLAASILGKR
jgi:hypothetical protein